MFLMNGVSDVSSIDRRLLKHCTNISHRTNIQIQESHYTQQVIVLRVFPTT
jgi:hypothetical protein